MDLQFRNKTSEIPFELLNPGDVFFYNGDYYLVYAEDLDSDQNEALLINNCDFCHQPFSNDTIVELRKATLVIE